MPNRISACQGCPDNTPKTKGGYGRNCNGYTQEQFGRCPEWKINELREKRQKEEENASITGKANS